MHKTETAWLSAVAILYAAQLITQSAWTIPYNWATNNVSDLGNITCATMDGREICSPWHVVFNGAVVTVGVLIVVGAVLSRDMWATRRLAVSPSLGVGAVGVGYVVVGAFPADVALGGHLVGALLVLPVAAVALGWAAVVGSPSWTVGYRCGVAALAVIGFGATVLHFARIDVVVGVGGMERIALMCLPLYLVLESVRMLRSRASATTAVTG